MKSLLYTRTGDSGTTSLVGGERVKKNSVRLEAYGTIDELSSCMGVITSDRGCDAGVKSHLMDVQNELFNIGCYLATAVGEGASPRCASLDEARMQALEGWIDTLDEKTPKIRAFVLPGGCPLAASCSKIAEKGACEKKEAAE